MLTVLDKTDQQEQTAHTRPPIVGTVEERQDGIDTDRACTLVSAMWLRLAEQIRDAIPDIVIADDTPGRAIRWATCAEACFWQATGEASLHDIKDALLAAALKAEVGS